MRIGDPGTADRDEGSPVLSDHQDIRQPVKRKTALILAGGGMPGWMYEIGCLKALDEFFQGGFTVNDFDIYVGISAGASAAALLANQVSPREVYDAVEHDRAHYANFRRQDIYGVAWQALFGSLRKINRMFWPILKNYWRNRNRFSSLDLLHMLQESLPAGLFSLVNYERYLRQSFSLPGLTNDFRQLRHELYIPAVDLDRGRFDVFGEGEFADVPISEAVAATAAIPILFVPYRLRGRDYVDGGIARFLYMDVAMNHGADLLLIINPVVYLVNDRSKVRLQSPAGDCSGIADKGFYYVFDQGVKINTETRIHMAMMRYRAEYPEKKFLIIQPEMTDAVMFDQNVITLSGSLDTLAYGYASTVKYLTAHYAEFEKAFNEHGLTVSLKRFSLPPAVSPGRGEGQGKA